MSVALIASDKMPLREVCGLIRDEGVAVSALGPEAKPQQDAADIFFLHLGELELIGGGETRGHVSEALGREKKLIVCMPMPIDRAALMEMGADEIITPAAVA